MRGLYQRGGRSCVSCARGTCPSLGGVGFAPLARRQAGKLVGADGHAHQAQGRMTHGRGHAPHLAVAALGDNEFDPGGRDVAAHANGWIAWPQFRLGDAAHFSRARTAIVEWHAAAQSIQGRVCWFTLNLHPIRFRQLVFRVGDALLQFAVVGQQKQTFAVVVEPPGCAHLRLRNEFCERAPAFLVGELTQDIERLVEQDEHYRSSVSSCA